MRTRRGGLGDGMSVMTLVSLRLPVRVVVFAIGV